MAPRLNLFGNAGKCELPPVKQTLVHHGQLNMHVYHTKLFQFDLAAMPMLVGRWQYNAVFWLFDCKRAGRVPKRHCNYTVG